MSGKNRAPDYSTWRLSRRHALKLALGAASFAYLESRGGLAAAAKSLVGDGGAQAAGASTATQSGRQLYRNVAIADGLSSQRRTQMSILVDSGKVSWIRPADAEEDPGPVSGLTIINGAGLTAIPGMVDAHCHLTSPGGKNWLDHFLDPPSTMLQTADKNGQLARQAGTAWLREVGSPTVIDPVSGRRRALALSIRDRWASRSDRPQVRSAGTWIAPPGVLARGVAVVVRSGAEMVAAALGQLDQGADLVKLYVEDADSTASPWSAAQIKRVVDAVHARGAKVTAHAMRLAPATAAVMGGVDAVEHGFRLDADLCAEMARRGTRLVTTLIVPRSWLLIGQTSGGYFATRAGRRYAKRLLERGEQSARFARQAGVVICAGTDFGGGGSRAGQLAWEIESLVATGMQPWQAIGAATWRGGELMGEPRAGRLVEGARADFFLVSGDPYSDPAVMWNVKRLA